MGPGRSKSRGPPPIEADFAARRPGQEKTQGGPWRPLSTEAGVRFSPPWSDQCHRIPQEGITRKASHPACVSASRPPRRLLIPGASGQDKPGW